MAISLSPRNGSIVQAIAECSDVFVNHCTLTPIITLKMRRKLGVPAFSSFVFFCFFYFYNGCRIQQPTGYPSHLHTSNKCRPSPAPATKGFLCQCGFDDAAKGGLGSFALVRRRTHFFQVYPFSPSRLLLPTSNFVFSFHPDEPGPPSP